MLKKGRPQVRDVVLGLRHLHSLDPPIVHGNLKAVSAFTHVNVVALLTHAQNNVFIREDGTACIADVGLAQVLDASTFYTSNSSSRFRWLAPEILAMHEDRELPYTTKSDMYAFAMTVIEASTLFTSEWARSDSLDSSDLHGRQTIPEHKTRQLSRPEDSSGCSSFATDLL